MKLLVSSGFSYCADKLQTGSNLYILNDWLLLSWPSLRTKRFLPDSLTHPTPSSHTHTFLCLRLSAFHLSYSITRPLYTSKTNVSFRFLFLTSANFEITGQFLFVVVAFNFIPLPKNQALLSFGLTSLTFFFVCSGSHHSTLTVCHPL